MAKRTQISSFSIQGLQSINRTQSGSLFQISARGIKAKKLVTSQSMRLDAKRMSQDLYGQIDGCMGIVKLNKEHKYNLLTPGFIDEINRGITSMEVNQIISTIYMAPHLGQMFSNGTDFRTLAHMQKEGSGDAIASYMQKLYQLQVQVAALNKPLITVAPGHCFNSGATLMAASGIPLVQQGSKIAINEVQFGFVPHAGATYYLSRLPGEFGTFMALTGMSLDGSDAVQLKLAHGAVQDPLKLQDEVAEIVRSQEWRPNQGSEYHEHHNTKDGRDEVQDPTRSFFSGSGRRALEELHHMNKFNIIDQNRLNNGSYDMGKYEEFIEAQDRIPSAVADAEYRYMKMLRRDQALHGGQQRDGYLEFGKNEIDRDNLFLYHDGFKTQHTYLTSFLDHWYHQDINTAIKHKKLIERCFYPRSVEEIMDKLRQEPHPFAKECLEQMERNSMVSMQLTREMMHKAQNLDYTGCMEMEVSVALNRIRDPDFIIGVEKVIRAKTPFSNGQKDKRKNPGFSKKKMTQSEIDRYFEPSEFSKKVNVGAVRHALLPTRHYFERFSDHLRIWINEESTADDRIRETFDEQAKEALKQHGIDVRDKSLTIQSAREHLAAKLGKERVEQVRKERFDQIMLDEGLRDQYFLEVNNQLGKLLENKELFYQRVNKHIKEIFDMALQERVQKIYQKSKEAQSLEQRRMYVRLKKFMFKNRVLTYAKESFDNELERCKNYPYRLLHGQENNDQSWHDIVNPLIEKSPLYQISKAIGRVSLSPVEITREFLTKPERREQLTMLTLDQDELHKLQNDVIQNPDKYIQIFTKPEKPHEDLIYHFNSRELPEMKFQIKEIWWRMYNDYITPQDTWPYKQKFEMYQAWASTVESQAIDTLRNCISQLLLSLKENILIKPDLGGNTVSKRKKLERLMAHLDEAGELMKNKPNEKLVLKPKKQAQKDDLKSLHTFIQKMLSNDRTFSPLYQLNNDGELTKNQKIVALRTEAEQELLKLIEIVLLDKFGKFTTEQQKQKLNERLDSLLKPQGSDKNQATVQQQLGVIDWYLDNETRHESLRDALDLVKPYFVNIFQRRLQEAASSLLEDIQFKTTNHLVQIYYFGEQAFPGFVQGQQLEKKMLNQNEEHEANMKFEAAFPFMTPQFKKREVQSAWGFERQDLHMDKNYQKLSLKEKKQLELDEAKLRNQQWSEVEAEDQMAKFNNQGIHDLDGIIQSILQGSFSTEAQKLLDSLHEKNIELLRKHGVSKKNIQQFKELVDMKKELDAQEPKKRAEVDYQEAYDNLKLRDQYEIDSLRSQEKQIHTFLDSIRYEIEHNLTAFDWLKMYSKVISNVNFNEVIDNYHYNQAKIKAEDKLSPEERMFWTKPNINYTPPTNLFKSKDEWKEIKEYADFITQFFNTSNQTVNDQATVDIEKFMKSHNSDKSIFQQALAARNEFVKKYKQKHTFDRNLLIKDQISDFNQLQEQKEINRRLKVEIMTSAANKPQEIRTFVQQILTDNKSYVDLHLLKENLQSGDITKTISGLINTEKLITDLKHSNETLPGFNEKFASMSIDVLSLDTMKTMILTDNSLSKKDKVYALDIIQHVQDQTTYVSNAQRKSITLAQFLGNHHYTNSESFTKYASNVLSQKLKDVVNSIEHTNTEDSSNVQWELGRSRTSPFDLKLENRKSQEQIQDLINRIIEDKEEDPDKKITYYDAEANAYRLDPLREHELKKVMLDAADATTLPQDLDQVQIYFENQFLLAITSPEKFEEKAQEIIKEYTDKRLKYCMLQPNFQDKIKSKYGFIYMKMLRERVSDELQLTKDSEPMALSYKSINDQRKKQLWYDVEAKYNLSHLNNTNALGFDNLVERAQAKSEAENFDIAQKSVLDKLLSDYFLSKKTEYSQANQLIKGLAQMFEDKVPGENSGETVFQTLCQQEIDKGDSKQFHFEAFKDMIDLDVITSRAIQNNKNGLSNELRSLSISEKDHEDHWLTQVPDYFAIMDVRKPPEEVVDDKLFLIIKQAFDVRKELEQKMNRRELLAFDKVLARHLQMKNLSPRLQESIKEEFNLVNQGRQVAEQSNNNKWNDQIQMMKRDSMQREFNKNVKDSDAQFKQLAFSTILELEGKAILNKPGKVSEEKLELIHVDDTFSRWYLRELEKDVKREPRPINAADFRKKKPFELTPVTEKFKDKNDREAAHFEDHSIFLENKKEQQDRIQLFYVLEQFFEHSRTKTDPKSEAQAQIKEYFSKPENTFFFDKNKI